MSDPAPHPARFPVARMAAGGLIGALCCAALVQRTDLAGLAAALAQLHWHWLAAAFACDLGAFAVRALKQRWLLGHPAGLGYRASLATVFAGALATDILPLRADELVRAQAIALRTGMSRRRVLGVLAVERGIDLAWLAGLAVLVLLWAPVPPWLLGGAAALLGAAALGGAALAAARLLPVPRWAGEVQLGVRAALGRVAGAAAIAAAEWALLFATFACGLAAFGVAAPAVALAVLVASFAVFACALAPAGLGVYGVAIAAVLDAAGVEPAVPIALVLHALVLAPAALAGPFALAALDLGWGELLRLASPSPRLENA